jgi:trimeric autotransporter adhesin
MKTLLRRNLGYIGLFALAGAAYGQVPSTNDTTDGTNTGMGSGALSGPNATLTGEYNTGSGYGPLFNIGSGTGNTAVGALAMSFTTSGIYNTGCGFEALFGNSSGSTGSLNTGVGAAALFSYSTGSDNTALGYEALFSTTSGNDNTASGYYALYYNTTGNYNVASGYQALFKNKVGVQNTAYGANVLYAANASFNTGIGYEALLKNTSGKYNIALGWEAGSALTAGSNNIEIGNVGVAGESDTIRIGSATQTAAYMAGIYSTTVTSGRYVVVDANGQLGATATPPSASLRSAYTPNLLEEIQRQAAQLRDLQEQLEELKALNQTMRVALPSLQAQNELVAQQ